MRANYTTPPSKNGSAQPTWISRLRCGLLLALICVGSHTTRAQASDSGIGAVIKAYEKALRASDTAAVMGLYGKEPVFVPPNSKGLVGREAVQAGYDHVFKAIKVNVTFTVHEVVELGDTAYARTSSAGEVNLLASNAMVKDAYNELFIFRKEAGHWKIHRYIYNSGNPPAGN